MYVILLKTKFHRTRLQRRIGSALIVFLASVVLLSGFSSIRGADEPALNWTEVEPSARNAILDMLVSQLQGNYERIRTWMGKYSIQQDELVSESFVAGY